MRNSIFIWDRHVPQLTNKEDTGEKNSSFFHRDLNHMNPDYDNCGWIPVSGAPLPHTASSRAFPPPGKWQLPRGSKEKCSVPESARSLDPQHLQSSVALWCKYDPSSLVPRPIFLMPSLNAGTWCISVTNLSQDTAHTVGSQRTVCETDKWTPTFNSLPHKCVTIFHVIWRYFKISLNS